MITRRTFFFTPLALLPAVTVAFAPAAFAQPTPPTIGPAPDPLLDGFHLLYHLRFADARAIFQAWQRDHPADPMGFVAEAASHLFEEFEHHGVLTTEFFLDDDRLLGGIKGQADPARTKAFERANNRARSLSEAALQRDKDDANALLALTLASGMRADYLSIIEKSQISSLKEIRNAESFGQRLLKVAPQTGDAYMALGAANYILACLPSYKRALLWFGSMQGDKQRGIQQLTEASRTGHYLAPYAKILLALALIREKRTGDASRLMSELTAAFPQSLLFAREQKKIQELVRHGE